jgi:hypothetical protein
MHADLCLQRPQTTKKPLARSPRPPRTLPRPRTRPHATRASPSSARQGSPRSASPSASLPRTSSCAPCSQTSVPRVPSPAPRASPSRSASAPRSPPEHAPPTKSDVPSRSPGPGLLAPTSCAYPHDYRDDPPSHPHSLHVYIIIPSRTPARRPHSHISPRFVPASDPHALPLT